VGKLGHLQLFILKNPPCGTRGHSTLTVSEIWWEYIANLINIGSKIEKAIQVGGRGRVKCTLWDK
jgi:hypothetical protein